ncbi:MAG TPA: hypothetical protein VNM38_07620 [Solirubrobacterales bacterium]|nr:hypothetical protein [Solirubrobacterales bacterium]
MHDQSKAAPTEAEDLKDQSAVLMHVVKSHPATLRLSDLTRELGDPEDFAERDGIERAVRELVQFGLLFRCEGAVLPTRCALRAYEVLGG